MAKPKAIECPVCGVCRLHPGDFFESALRKVRWGQCLCSDENVCIGHTVSDEAMPERPPDAVLIERARVQHAGKIKRWEEEAARFAKHAALTAEVERLREVVRKVHGLAEKALGEYWTVGIAAQTLREIHKLTKGDVLMGACFHIAGVYCDNCRTGMSGSVLRPLTGAPLTGNLAGSYPPPLATAESLDALRAEVAALKKELDNLRVVVATLRAESEGTGPQPYRITACPRCCSSVLAYSTIGSFGGPTKYQIDCRDCDWKRYD